jgi:hypothetical protein
MDDGSYGLVGLGGLLCLVDLQTADDGSFHLKRGPLPSWNSVHHLPVAETVSCAQPSYVPNQARLVQAILRRSGT